MTRLRGAKHSPTRRDRVVARTGDNAVPAVLGVDVGVLPDRGVDRDLVLHRAADDADRFHILDLVMRLGVIGPREERGAVGVGADRDPVESHRLAFEDQHPVHEVDGRHEPAAFEGLEERRLADLGILLLLLRLVRIVVDVGSSRLHATRIGEKLGSKKPHQY
jgi:hypothetical protein